MKLILAFLFVSFVGLPGEKSFAQVNNIPVSVVRDGEGIHAGPYSFDKNKLYKKSGWTGQWIWLNKGQFPDRQRTSSAWINPAGPCQYRALFRKSFGIDQLPARATLFLTADVRFRIYINGVAVGEGPANTGGDYGDTVSPKYWYYSSFDVRDKLKKGKNTIAVEVFAWALEGSDVTSSFGRLLADLQDGDNKMLVKTDTSWKSFVDSSYHYAEDFLQYDAGKGPGGWPAISFDDSRWPTASVQHTADSTRLYQSNIPVCMEYPVKPARVFAARGSEDPIGTAIRPEEFYGRHQGSSHYILDFGRNMAAHISFAVTAGAGDTLDIISYEKAGPTRGSGRKYRYVCQKGLNTFRTPSVSPFRTLGVRVSTRTTLTIQRFDAGFSTYPVQYRGDFYCSDSFYNRLWSIVRYTTQLCMSDLYFDSPMHQEPIGCTGDYFIESMNSYYAFGDRWLTRQNLVQTAQMMEKNDYRMFHTSYSLLWVQMLRQYVQFTGDTALLRELLPAADKLMERFRRYIGKDGLVSEAPNYMFMDWITIKGYNAHHPPAMIGMGYMSALLFKAMKEVDEMRLLAERVAIGGVKPMSGTKTMSDPGRAHPRYAATADSIRAAMNTLLWDPARQLYRDGIPFTTRVAANGWMPADSNVITYSAHVNTLAVLYDIAPPDSRAAIMEYVVGQNEYELQPYFMSYVLGAAQKVGWDDKGLRLIDRWRNGIDTGTYTLKENWRDKTDFGYGGDYSHAWGGAPLRWLSANVLGISPEGLGYAPIAIYPYTGAQLTWARGVVPVGDTRSVTVSWKKKDGILYLDYTIPVGMSANFYIPVTLGKNEWVADGRQYSGVGPISLAAGKHSIRCVL